jgi:GTPase SAR1 family protein
VGKTCALLRAASDQFTENYIPDESEMSYSIQMMIAGRMIFFHCCDAPGDIHYFLQQESVSSNNNNHEMDAKVNSFPTSLDTASMLISSQRSSSSALKDVDAFVVCFSLVNISSFTNAVQTWVPIIRYSCPKTPIFLVGCKLDLSKYLLNFFFTKQYYRRRFS